MAKAKHKPPARIRYDQSHPTVSCRLDRDTHDLLNQRLEDLGVSFADFVKDSLDLLQLKIPRIDKIKQRAQQKGYEQAVKDWQIWYFCSVCGERIDVEPNGEAHKAIMRYMEEHEWGHKSCHRR